MELQTKPNPTAEWWMFEPVAWNMSGARPSVLVTLTCPDGGTIVLDFDNLVALGTFADQMYAAHDRLASCLAEFAFGESS